MVDVNDLLLKIGGALITFVGIVNAVNAGVPGLPSELGPVMSIAFIVVGLILMGHRRMAGQITNAVERLRS